MKPTLEQINIENSLRSFHFFERKDRAFLPYWHYHPELELTLITKGSGTRFIGDSIRPYSDFDLVLIGENLPHHWVSLEEEAIPFQEAYVFQFSKDLFTPFPECDAFTSLFQQAGHGLQFLAPSELLIEQIVSFDIGSPIAQLSSLMNILQDLVQDENRVSLASPDFLFKFQKEEEQSKIAQTTNYILEHLDQKLSVGQMAEFTHMVPQSFCRWFKKHSGHSFISFLNQSRVQRACHLLLSTDRSIQDIAFSCGFESISHFNRTFKKIKGCSPSSFKKGIGEALE